MSLSLASEDLDLLCRIPAERAGVGFLCTVVKNAAGCRHSAMLQRGDSFEDGFSSSSLLVDRVSAAPERRVTWAITRISCVDELIRLMLVALLSHGSFNTTCFPPLSIAHGE